MVDVFSLAMRTRARMRKQKQDHAMTTAMLKSDTAMHDVTAAV
ncbi:MAG: hypothetical protein ABIH21_05620 [Patescibacteria group bacterium]